MKEFDYNELAMRVFLERIHELEEKINQLQGVINEQYNNIRNLHVSLDVTEKQLNSLKEKYEPKE